MFNTQTQQLFEKGKTTQHIYWYWLLRYVGNDIYFCITVFMLNLDVFGYESSSDVAPPLPFTFLYHCIYF